MPAPNTLLALQLAQAIEAKRAELATLEATWEDLWRGSKSVESATEEKPATGRKLNPDGISGRVISLMNREPTQEFTPERLIDELNIERKQSEKVLNNLFSAGRIRRVGRGRYMANRPFEISVSSITVDDGQLEVPLSGPDEITRVS